MSRLQFLFVLFAVLFTTPGLRAQSRTAGKQVQPHIHAHHTHHDGTPAHRTCGTDARIEELKRNHPELAKVRAEAEKQIKAALESGKARKTQAVITIPVVVHVVYRNATENISDAQIQSQIDVLNADYRRLNADRTNTPSAFTGVAADTEIEFCLASVDPSGNPTNGITRHQTTINNIGQRQQLYSTAVYWDNSKYLNFWVCRIGGGTLGFATPPGFAPNNEDGCVIDYRYFGTIGTATFPFNGGRTTTHEVGHYLNLDHVWGPGAGSCGQDDGVNDTPNSDGPYYNCPTSGSSCGSADMYMNYLDYVDDRCMNLFTTGQASVMRAALNGPRASIQLSNACTNTPSPTVCKDTLNFPLTGTPTLYLSTGSNAWGYVSGHNNYGDLAKADRFANFGSATQIDGVYFRFGAAAAASSSSKVTVNIWNEVNGEPGTVIGSADLLIDDIITNNGRIAVNFTNPVQITGTFYAGIEMTYAAGDTIGVVTNRDGDISTNIAWEKWDDNTWHEYDEVGGWELTVAHAIHPIVSAPFTVTVTPASPTIAQGNSVALTASGASSYTWSPSTGLSSTTGATVTASPNTTTTYTVTGADQSGQCTENTTVTVTVTPGTSMDDIFAQGQISIFPNPGNGHFTLNFSLDHSATVQLTLSDLTGKQMLGTDLEVRAGQFNHQLDLTNLSAGVYFLRLQEGNKSIVKKLIIR